MITPEEFEKLRRPSVRALIDAHIEADPVRLALGLGLEEPGLGALICTQVKYLQRARYKLPVYYAARCVLPGLSYEQASSEQSAAARPYRGVLCIDLTGGLGVDSLYFSKRFERVISVEASPELAAITQYNFALLGRLQVAHQTSTASQTTSQVDTTSRIELRVETAEAFVAAYTGPRADLVYVDPDRRDAVGKKQYLLEACQPNVVALLPRLLQIGRCVVLKVSPLFDVREAFRIFGGVAGCRVCVEVVSVEGECKEVLIEITHVVAGNPPSEVIPRSQPDLQEGCIGLTVIRNGQVERFVFQGREKLGFGCVPLPVSPLSGRYLLIPDVVFYKARLVSAYLKRMDATGSLWAASETGFCFSEQLPGEFCGKVFEIEEWIPYHPKIAKKLAATYGINRLNILKREFPFTTEELKKQLGISEGGTRFAAFTKIGTVLYLLLLRDSIR